MATCGISAGADKVYAALAQRIAELGLDVVLAKTGCIGFCQREPWWMWSIPSRCA